MLSKYVIMLYGGIQNMNPVSDHTELDIPVYSLNHTDLNMYQCGTQDCAPGHYYGPAVRDHFLIHCIFKGKGRFCIKDKTYYLHAGQGFLICPGDITYYQADMGDPWHYSWVGFHGLKAETYLKNALLSADNPIFSFEKDYTIKKCFNEMISAQKYQKSREIRLLGLLYIFLSELVEQSSGDGFIDHPGSRRETYLKKAIEYIEMNYSRKIAVSDIAHYLGLDRSYLGSIFKQQLNCSLRDFLINFRMNKACELMKNKELSIGDISRSVGYEDPFLFSKVFKKTKSLPPREYRKNYQRKSFALDNIRQ